MQAEQDDDVTIVRLAIRGMVVIAMTAVVERNDDHLAALVAFSLLEGCAAITAFLSVHRDADPSEAIAAIQGDLRSMVGEKMLALRQPEGRA
jgi:hypothetical protein